MLHNPFKRHHIHEKRGYSVEQNKGFLPVLTISQKREKKLYPDARGPGCHSTILLQSLRLANRKGGKVTLRTNCLYLES